MNKFTQLLLTAFLPLSLFSAPVLAKGELTVEFDNGDTDVYSDVEIADTKDVIYFKTPESENLLLISKKECSKEGQILVCDKAKIGLQSYGVLEELGIKEIFLFINPSNEPQTIQGSQVILHPNTILLEAATNEGNFITGLGKIDSTAKPVEALK